VRDPLDNRAKKKKKKSKGKKEKRKRKNRQKFYKIIFNHSFNLFEHQSKEKKITTLIQNSKFKHTYFIVMIFDNTSKKVEKP